MYLKGNLLQKQVIVGKFEDKEGVQAQGSLGRSTVLLLEGYQKN